MDLSLEDDNGIFDFIPREVNKLLNQLANFLKISKGVKVQGWRWRAARII